MATPAPTTAAPALVVVCDRLPGHDAGRPEDRERARRIEDLAAVTAAPIVVAVLEPGLGATDTRWLGGMGGTLLACVVDPVAALRAALVGACAIIATETHHVPLLQAAGWRSAATPLLLDLTEVASLAHRAAAGSLAGIKADGHQAIIERTEAVDRAALGAADVVLCGHARLVDELDALGAGATHVAVSAVAATTPMGVQRRRLIVHPGRWSTEPGTPDEEGARLLVDAVSSLTDAPVLLAGLDVDPRLRHVVQGDVRTAPPSALDRSLRLASVACVARPRGCRVPSLLVELRRLGVPTVATTAAGGDVAWDATAIADAIEPLLASAAERDAARAAGFELLAAEHDPARCRAALRKVLDGAGIPTVKKPAKRAVVAPPDAGCHLERAPGSLAAADPALADFERELFGGPFLGRITAIRLEHPVDEDRRYRLWASTWNRPREHRAAAATGSGPGGSDLGISIVVPTWNTPAAILTETIDSVLAQTDPRWQLCIADDASAERATHQVLDRYEAADERISVVRLTENQGIAGASNAALATATQAFIGLLDHDDLLAPDAIEWVLRLIERSDGELDYVYTDEDKIDPFGMHAAPFCKPDWNPDLLLSCNYLTHFSVLRRSLVEEIGGFRTGFDGSQDYDLLLRATERTDRIGHVARPLYSWRQIEGSTSIDTGAKPAAHGAGRRALEEALVRRGIEATVTDGHMATWHRVQRHHAEQPLVTVIIPTRDHVELVRTCVDRVRRTVRHPHLELMVVDNQSTDPETVAWLAEHERSGDGSVVRYPHEFSYARQMNLAAAAARGSVLFMLNNDAKPRSDGWFEAMLEHALRPEVGVVGGRLRYPDGRAQHEGIILNVGGPAYNLDSGPKAEWGRTIRDVVGVTGAAMMCRASVYREAGGFEERLRVAFNDVDFCLRVGELGYRIVYTPYAELEHKESASRGALHPQDDEDWYLDRWGPPYAIRDPFYNHTMDLMSPLMFRV